MTLATRLPVRWYQVIWFPSGPWQVMPAMLASLGPTVIPAAPYTPIVMGWPMPPLMMVFEIRVPFAFTKCATPPPCARHDMHGRTCITRPDRDDCHFVQWRRGMFFCFPVMTRLVTVPFGGT